MDKESFEKQEPVAVDFTADWVPEKAKKLEPQVFYNGASYSCLFGPDPVVGIFGSGTTPEEAVIDWERDLQERIERLTEGDDAVHHAVKHLGQH
jgi:hypothetical protein